MDAPALQIDRGDACCTETVHCTALRVRGVGWVLRWAAVTVVVFYSAIVLAAFSYRISAEHALHGAARLGLREAALPRATSQSVESAVRNCLAARHPSLRTASVHLTAGGQPLCGPILGKQSEQLALSLAATTADFIPRWMTLLTGEAPVVVRVDQHH